MHRRCRSFFLGLGTCVSFVLPLMSTTIPARAETLLPQGSAASSASTQQSSINDLLLGADAGMGQVTSVNQLSDVRPTDWAYQALASLVEKYGCIAGYPDGTFRGNRALTRFEMAAALNACLDVISDRFASKEDLETVRKLMQDYAAELATLRGRVDNLEARTAALEATQFSTTTKLTGQAIFSFEAAGGGAPGGTDPNPVVNYRVRLNLNTSFTGKDMLITGLQAANFGGALLGGNSVQNTLFPGSLLDSGSTNLSFAPQFAFDPSNLNSSAYTPNTLNLYKLLYIFPVTSKFTAFVFPKAETTDAFPQIIPWANDGQGAISRFATVNPIARLSGGTSGIGLASGAGFIWNPSQTVNLTALYGSVTAGIPTLQPGVNPLGSGFFPNDENSFTGALQATFTPNKKLAAAFNFAYSQHAVNILGTGLSSNGLLGTGGDVFAIPGSPNGLAQRVQLVGLGGTFTYNFTDKIAFSAYGAGIIVDAIGGTNTLAGGALAAFNGKSYYTSFMGGIYFKDAFFQGNAAGFIFGQPLYLEGTTIGTAALNATAGFTKARPFQLETFYRFQVNDNLSVTPGVFVIFNPEFNSDNQTTVVGVLRSTFTF
ncbi:iron uptake porin [Thermosynechococcus sp. FA-CM-4201]